MKRILLRTLKLLVALYIIICIFLYFFQEKIIFYPEKLDKNYQFRFSGKFEEISITTTDNHLLNTVLFSADSSRGLIFYLHGNAGSVATWGEMAGTYTSLGYDVFMLDYRGYGKSEGSISGQEQFFSDIQEAYNEMRKRYKEDSIVILGYSIGTGPAAKLASDNHPRLLILQAPYYSLGDVMRNYYPIIPTFLLKYKFRTNDFLRRCKVPTIIFHSTDDEVIYYGSSLKLKKNLKRGDTLITLEGAGHNGITANKGYLSNLERILRK